MPHLVTEAKLLSGILLVVGADWPTGGDQGVPQHKNSEMEGSLG